MFLVGMLHQETPNLLKLEYEGKSNKMTIQVKTMLRKATQLSILVTQLCTRPW